jgi:hypothetical protein
VRLLPDLSKFAAVSELSTAMKMLNPDKFSKMIAFLRTSAVSKIRGKSRRRGRKPDTLLFWATCVS